MPIAPYVFCLWFVVLVFWTAVVLLLRSQGRMITPNILVLPVFFLLLGTVINRLYLPWGTYGVCLVHAMFLPALLKIARYRP
jgi:hypothetical protein